MKPASQRWSLGLSREEAAEYIGVGPTKFDELVAIRQMPEPHEIGNRVVWDQEELWRAFKDLPRRSPKTGAQLALEKLEQRR